MMNKINKLNSWIVYDYILYLGCHGKRVMALSQFYILRKIMIEPNEYSIIYKTLYFTYNRIIYIQIYH